MLKEYKLFRRESVEGDPRRRWHHVASTKATSRTQALRNYLWCGYEVKRGEFLPNTNVVAPEAGYASNDGLFIPKRANSAPDVDGTPCLAWESGKVEFEFFNCFGTFIPAGREANENYPDDCGEPQCAVL